MPPLAVTRRWEAVRRAFPQQLGARGVEDIRAKWRSMVGGKEQQQERGGGTVLPHPRSAQAAASDLPVPQHPAAA